MIIILYIVIGIICLGVLGWIVKGIGSFLGLMFEGIGEGMGCIIKLIFWAFLIFIAIGLIASL